MQWWENILPLVFGSAIIEFGASGMPATLSAFIESIQSLNSILEEDAKEESPKELKNHIQFPVE
jgi:hypothetical protein